jgi:hypothetical protein
MLLREVWAMMQVSYDENTGIIRSSISGFNAGSDLDAYIADILAFTKKCVARFGYRLHLVDARDSALQSGEDADKMRLIAAGETRIGDRTAVLKTSALAKMQAQRIAPGTQYGFFDDEAEAIAWLLSPQDLRKAG